MPDIIEEIRLRWIKEQDDHNRFRLVLAELTEETLKSNGMAGRVTSRLKTIDSLVRKLMKQVKEGREPAFESVVDKVGVRAVVRFKEEVEEAASVFRSAFRCLKLEFKSEGKQSNEFGYQSCHMDIGLREDHPNYSLFRPFVGELQVRTVAQDLWADMAHELSYKSVLRDLAPSMQTLIDRRIYILSALVESADMEFSRINKEILSSEGAENLLLLRALEREYYKFTSRTYDPEFSLESIAVLGKINPRPIHQLRRDLSDFSEKNNAKLAHIFTDQASNQDRSAFLFQPEAILIFEFLDSRPIELEDVWQVNFPTKELERLASAWATPVF
jgi:ppGpp synthetase/RelA/SpoT-type nucleotidyltranferase